MSKRRKRILLIGQYRPILEGVHDLLQLAGYQVHTLLGQAESSHPPDAPPPDLILVDLSLGSEDSFRVSQAIRGDRAWQTVPVLFMTFVDISNRLEPLACYGESPMPCVFVNNRLGVNRLLEAVQARLSAPH